MINYVQFNKFSKKDVIVTSETLGIITGKLEFVNQQEGIQGSIELVDYHINDGSIETGPISLDFKDIRNIRNFSK